MRGPEEDRRSLEDAQHDLGVGAVLRGKLGGRLFDFPGVRHPGVGAPPTDVGDSGVADDFQRALPVVEAHGVLQVRTIGGIAVPMPDTGDDGLVRGDGSREVDFEADEAPVEVLLAVDGEGTPGVEIEVDVVAGLPDGPHGAVDGEPVVGVAELAWTVGHHAAEGPGAVGHFGPAHGDRLADGVDGSLMFGRVGIADGGRVGAFK